MLSDSFNRPIYYLRLAVTGACNLKCSYCAPDNSGMCEKGGTLTAGQLKAIISAAGRVGFTKLRFTGGEPLVRKDLIELIEYAAGWKVYKYISMTTNGTLLAPLAVKLHRAGLNSVNISLDSLDAERYAHITGGGRLQNVLDGITAAKEAGFECIKINSVVGVHTTQAEVLELAAFCQEQGLIHQRIKEYRLYEKKVDDPSFDRPPRCGGCNRIRVTSDGYIKPCLHGDEEIPIDFSDVESSLQLAVLHKPRNGGDGTNRPMVQIGG